MRQQLTVVLLKHMAQVVVARLEYDRKARVSSKEGVVSKRSKDVFLALDHML
jgi:hypothetical protein